MIKKLFLNLFLVSDTKPEVLVMHRAGLNLYCLVFKDLFL